MGALIRIFFSWLALFVIASGSMSLTGCSDSDQTNSDIVKYDIRLDVSEENIEDVELVEMTRKINANQGLSHNLVSQKFHELHAHKANAQEISNFINGISADLKETDYFKRKNLFERRIEENASQAIIYNKKANTVSHIVTENQLQSYSGTSLALMVNRNIEEGQTYEKRNYVVIFEAGHLLAGKMMKIQGQWELFGVESTSDGDALRSYGLASELEYGKVRVVDASLFLLIELFKGYLLSPTSTADSAIGTTAKKYGIDLQNFGSQPNELGSFMTQSKKCGHTDFPFRSPLGSKDQVIYSRDFIHMSPFGFGCPASEVPDIDLERTDTAGIGVSNENSILLTLEDIAFMKAARNEQNQTILEQPIKPDADGEGIIILNPGEHLEDNEINEGSEGSDSAEPPAEGEEKDDSSDWWGFLT